MQHAPRISRAQAVVLPRPASVLPAEWILGAVGLALIALALLMP